MLFKNMQSFADEGLLYLETQANASNFLRSDGTAIPMQEVANIYRNRLAQQDAIDTGLTVRLQHVFLRFSPNAEQALTQSYQFVDKNRDLYVGINAAGREDNDKGYPLRFLSTLRKLRQTLPEVKLSFHAGEVDEPNYHVRDTLLLGVDRIGHGLNLIMDLSTMLLMRHNQDLVEINLN
jgi:adenosine deaminase CECR1